jgi:hypothetical protein
VVTHREDVEGRERPWTDGQPNQLSGGAWRKDPRKAKLTRGSSDAPANPGRVATDSRTEHDPEVARTTTSANGRG